MGTQKQVFHQALSQITTEFLDTKTNYKSLSAATEGFFKLLMELTEIDGELNAHRDPLLSNSGKCIGPFWAAMCLKDMVRTKKFVRGLYQGILAAQQTFPQTPIHIVYAGTGPFATLALPMTQLFSPEEIQFTLLEIQPQSADMLRKVVEALGIQTYIHDLIVTDAAEYQLDPAFPAHVLLSETMQNGLRSEPQVAIIMNLAPQLETGGIVIPERIEVWAGLLDPNNWLNQQLDTDSSAGPAHVLLRQLITLDADSPASMPEEGIFPAIEIDVSPALSAQFPKFCLFTKIQLYGTEIMRQNECSLTLPHELFNYLHKPVPPSKVVLQYVMGAVPGFRMHLIE